MNNNLDNINLPVERTITYNDILVQNSSDNLPLKVLSVQDSDGDTQALVNLDLNNAKILNNKTVDTVTLDVPVSAINLRDVYAKDVTIPLDFQIIPPILKSFYINVYRLVLNDSGNFDAVYVTSSPQISKNQFTYTESKLTLTNFNSNDSNDCFIIVQICYIASGFESGYYRIIFDKISASYMSNSPSGYYIYPKSYYYTFYYPYVAGGSPSSHSRFVLEGRGDVPGINQQNIKLFSVYDEEARKVFDGGNDDEAGTYGMNEGAVLRLSPQMISLAEFYGE